MSTGPSELLVGAVTYEVQYVSPDQMPESDTQSTVGLCDEAKTLIWISSESSETGLRAVLWHEALHAIVNEYGKGRQIALDFYLGRREHKPDQIEELFVGFVEVGVLCFVRDNPNAWAWINGLVDEWEEDQ